MLHPEQPQQQPPTKHINLIMNGCPEKSFQLSYRHHIELSDILKAAESRWNFKYARSIRIFNHEGVEFEQGDLRYVRPSDNLYVSRGEEFDANSSFGEYEILKPLGEGGFGRVALARHKSSQQLVAIKTMKAERIKSAHQIDVVFREIQNLKLLNHPNIVRIFKCFTLKQMKVVMVMEYLEGGQMLQYVKKRGCLDPKESLVFMRQIASAIQYCHRKNIVHRDLKLQNILLTSQHGQEIKVADFGISGVAEQFNPDCDIGTLKYMAPEVLSGHQKGNSPAIDVWAMGCIFYYLLFGRLPFVGKTSAETIKLIVEGAYKIPKDSEVEEDYLRLLSRMLDTSPKTRIKIFGVCEELRQFGQPQLMLLRTEDSTIETGRVTVELPQPSLIVCPPRPRKQSLVRRQRPSGLLPFIPKRLEKEKDQIENELREYKNSRKKPSGERSNLLRSYQSKRSQMNLPKRPLLRQKSLGPPTSSQAYRNSLSSIRKLK